MKTTLLLLASAFALSFFSTSLFAQYSARSLTRRVAPQPGVSGTATNQQPRQGVPPTPAPVTSPSPGAPPTSTAAPQALRRTSPVPVLTRPIDPEKERAARERAEQKSIEFEKQRAEKDYGWAQYALGVRYLTGKGVDKDLELARQWLEKAAKNGESQAVKKLAELDRQRGDVPETGSASGQPPKTADTRDPVDVPTTGSASKTRQK